MGRLYLVFEFVDQDLKKHMDSCSGTLDLDVRICACIVQRADAMQRNYY